MRTLIVAITLLAATASVAVAADSDSHWDGRLRLGGIYLDQTGNESTMPETYNIYEGFSLSSIYLKGRANPRTHLLLDLTNINQDSRAGVFDFRRTGTLHFLSRYNESRWVFDPTATVDATRTNWWNALSWTPSRSLWFSADYNLQTRDGNRMGMFPGYEGWLGTAYDSQLHRYRIAAETRAGNGIGGTLAYDGVAQRDKLDTDRERDGYVVSANVHVPGYYFKRLTHVVRGAIGRSEITESGLGFDMMNIQYTGLLQARDWLGLRYRFYGSQVDDEASLLQTDDFRNDIDATLRHKIGQLMLGYGWEALDDDRAVTTTNKFRGALSLRDPKNRVSGRVAYDARDKTDEESTTLMRDSQAERWDVRVDSRPMKPLSLGARFLDRSRDLPDLGTSADGVSVTAYGAWSELPGTETIVVTSVGVEYTYADDEYNNLYGVQHIVTNVVTGRIGLTMWEALDLTGSFTYMSASEDLDLDKSIISAGAGYRFGGGFLADVKYNVYNYDDYLILDRYYTANVVWFNVGYEFSTD